MYVRDKTIPEFELEINAKNKRIAELESALGDFLRLARYPWMHPERAPEAERDLVEELSCRAWRLMGRRQPEPIKRIDCL